MKKNRSLVPLRINAVTLCCLLLPLFSLGLGVVYVDKNATGANNGNSWTDAYTTIQAGIDDADVADEEVWVAQGTYYEAIVMKSGVSLYGGFNGTETSHSGRNWMTNVTTIDGSTARGGSPAYHVITMDSITYAAIDGFTITGGNANGSTVTEDQGGGIYCANVNGSNTIANNTITGNSASQGGGIYCGDNSLPTITNNTILANSFSGVYCASSSPIVKNNRILENSAISGGAISCHFSSSPMIMNNTISGNFVSSYGGGIYCSVSSPTITNNIIVGNWSSVMGIGGGIGCFVSSPIITNNTIAGNWAFNMGGGITLLASSPQISNTIFFNNDSYDIYEQDNNSDPIVSYNDFYGNSDGVYYDEFTTPYTSVSAIDAAIAECSNNIGVDPVFVGDRLTGGIWTANGSYNSSTFQTTLTNSSASWAVNEHVGRFLNPDTSHLRQFVIVSNTAMTVNVWGNATSIANIGDTYEILDYHLQPTSPCIDAGCYINGLNQDFEGDPRPFDGTSEQRGDGSDFDIGADEYARVVSANLWQLYE